MDSSHVGFGVELKKWEMKKWEILVEMSCLASMQSFKGCIIPDFTM